MFFLLRFRGSSKRSESNARTPEEQGVPLRLAEQASERKRERESESEGGGERGRGGGLGLLSLSVYDSPGTWRFRVCISAPKKRSVGQWHPF